MNSSTEQAGRIVDSAYDWTSGEVSALTFECGACGRTLLGTERHRRVDTHTTVSGQRIGRTYLFHLTCAPGWAARTR